MAEWDAIYCLLASQAIPSMKRVHELAYRVIVLDSDLQTCSSEHYTEAFIRIRLSTWMRRLRTLHEGVLANRLLVQFSDDLFDVRVGERHSMTILREYCIHSIRPPATRKASTGDSVC
ncbi:uncharacterized protein ATNIH1004_003933 [Aspergillus tanneri]|uniref:Uncharacterized protein n=1 Tax=Aspergillus tanneri TaxID=1220188 RepID=A0A5M9MRW5_9EURO|nr:uncharacterized protein ATNIH1004_003933 [Aspergillus tanneri]KAA8648050.1 hypothetical protein ATNIH1004_003933 [Aspergillus tanneri]